MKTRIAWLAAFSVMLILMCTSCKKDLKDFEFSYSMESVDNYKLLVSFDSDKKYRIEEYNYFFDNAANKREPIIQEGTLTDEELAQIKQLLMGSDLPSMKDSYGFEKEVNRDLGDIMYQIAFTTEGKDKFISIRDSDTSQFSSGFVRLIGYINTFLNNHKNK